MRTEPLLALRRSLLLALGLGGCTGSPEPVAPGGTAPRGGELPQQGYVREPDGTVHRASAEVCDPGFEAPACASPSPHHNECTSADQCSAGAYGQCVQERGQIGDYCRCDYSCKTDADCGPDQVCVCGGAFADGRHSRCVAARCKADAECGSGLCGLSSYFNGCSTDVQLACRTAGDACRSAADCGADAANNQCVFDERADRWDCLGISCVIGRPLIVDGAARTAPAVSRADWLTELDLPHDLPPAIRAALASHWSAVAALEHASVASFAAFTLDLMALAAPPDLLAEAQRAALDEIDHARVAWSLASLWAGEQLGPGPLAVDGLPLKHVLSDIVRNLIREGCIGETLGAAEAQFLAELADHPTMSPLLGTIAHDEARHAALAWRTLRWLLSTRGPEVRLVALTTVAEVRAELASAPEEDADAPDAPTWGLLRPSELLAHRREAFVSVVEPVLQAILGPVAQA